MKKSLYEQFSGVLKGDRGIPNSVREKLLQTGRGEAALVLDVCFFIGLREKDTFSCELLVGYCEKAGIGISTGLIRRALKDPLFVSYASVSVGRGRPVIMYQLRGIVELAEEVTDGWIGIADLLGVDDLSSLRAYRRGLHIAFIERCPGSYSREFLSGRLGVSARTTWFYEIGSGIRVTARYARSLLLSGMEKYLPKKAVRSHKFMEVVTGYDASGWEISKKFPLCAYLARQAIKAGKKCYEVARLPNHYDKPKTTEEWLAF